MRIFLVIVLLFLGCSKEKQKINQTSEINQTIKNTKPKNETIIHLDDMDLVFRDGNLVYPHQRVIILFENDFRESDVLKMLKVKYYKTDNEFLKNYFNIKIYPTIVVLDKNKTIKYENFTPYAILKEEGF